MKKQDELRSKTVGVRVTPEQYERIQKEADARYITPSTLGRVLFEMWLRGETKI